jgi:hypothetical protein
MYILINFLSFVTQQNVIMCDYLFKPKDGFQVYRYARLFLADCSGIEITLDSELFYI